MSRRRFLGRVGASAILTFATVALGQVGPTPGPLGFAPGSRAAQAVAEAHALAVPTPEKARSWLRTLTEEPHVAGTPADHKTALFVRDKLREWGWEADLAEYEVLLNYPQPRRSSSRSSGRRPAPSRSTKTPSPPTRTRPARTPSRPSTATESRGM